MMKNLMDKVLFSDLLAVKRRSLATISNTMTPPTGTTCGEVGTTSPSEGAAVNKIE